MKKMVKVVSILLMLGMITIGMHPISVSAENQNTNETIEMKVNVTERWENHYNAEIVITNVTEEKLDNWAVKFDYCDNIESIWNAKIMSHEEDSYVIKCLNWNQDIEAKGSVSFGITAKYDTEIGSVENAYIISDWVECEKEDYSISCRQTEQWDEGMSEEITIQNMSGDVIEDWCIEIVTNVEIEKIWNAEIEDHYLNDEGKDVYLLKNATYNQNIPAGDNCTLGFIAKKKEQSAEIQESNLYCVTLCERTDSESTLDNENADFENPMLIPPQDDFENYEEYLAYLTENIPMMLWSRAATYEASPLEKKERTVKQLYEIKGNINIRKKAIQNFCLSGNNYAYGVQHRGKDAYLIKFLLTTNNSGKK